MLRKIETLSRLLLGATVLASALACQADSPNKTSDQIVGPVAPNGIAVSVTSSKSSLTASGEGTATITVRAIRTDTGATVPDLTNFTLTTTLGSFDTPGGGNTVTIPSTHGVVTTTFYPGDTEGTARLSANVLGAIGLAIITIKPAVEVIPPPTASTLTISSDTVAITDEDPTSSIEVTATVLGSNLKPFKQAPVFFSVSPAIGLFNSSGGTVGNVKATNSAGKASDTLVVNGDDIKAISALIITATLTVEGGGTQTASSTVNVTHGALPPTPTTLTLSSDIASIVDDGTDQVVNLSARIQDQYGAVFENGVVTFSSSIPGAAFSGQVVNSDSNGIAATQATIQAADVAAHLTNSFTFTATLTKAIGTTTGNSPITIVIVRPVAPLSAEFTNDGPVVLGTHDVIQFTDASSGTPLTWAWDLDGDGFTDDSNIPNPTFNYAAWPTCSVNVTLVVTKSGGTVVSSKSHIITIDDGLGPCP